MVIRNYRGHVENGHIVLDEPAELAEGMMVEVRASEVAAAIPEPASNIANPSAPAKPQDSPHVPIGKGGYVLPSDYDESEFDPNAPSLYDTLKEFIGCIDDLPSDFAAQHDHYLYGTPKR